MPRHHNNPSGNVPPIPTVSPAVESANIGRRPPTRQQGRPKLHDVSNRGAEPLWGGATEKTELSVLEAPPPLRRSNRIEALKQQQQQQQQQQQRQQQQQKLQNQQMSQTLAGGARAGRAKKKQGRASKHPPLAAKAPSHRITHYKTGKRRRDSLMDVGSADDSKPKSTKNGTSSRGAAAKRSADDQEQKKSRTSKRAKTGHSKNVLDSFVLSCKVDETAENVMAPADERNVGAVLEVPEYATTIYQHLYSIENRFAVQSYTDEHALLMDTDRAELIDCLVQVAGAWNCEPQVLFLAVQIMDRYASQEEIDVDEFYRIGAVALFLASKHDEVCQLLMNNVIDFLKSGLGRSGLPPREVLVYTESLVLHALNFQISGPTSFSFLQRFLTIVNPSEDTKKRALYFLECTLYIEGLLNYRPSAVAATVVCLAIQSPVSSDIGPESMQKELLEYTQFSVELIQEIAEFIQIGMGDLVPSSGEAQKFLALNNKRAPYFNDKERGFAAWVKYSQKEHLSVSILKLRDLPNVSHLS